MPHEKIKDNRRPYHDVLADGAMPEKISISAAQRRAVIGSVVDPSQVGPDSYASTLSRRGEQIYHVPAVGSPG